MDELDLARIAIERGAKRSKSHAMLRLRRYHLLTLDPNEEKANLYSNKSIDIAMDKLEALRNTDLYSDENKPTELLEDSAELVFNYIYQDDKHRASEFAEELLELSLKRFLHMYKNPKIGEIQQIRAGLVILQIISYQKCDQDETYLATGIADRLIDLVAPHKGFFFKYDRQERVIHEMMSQINPNYKAVDLEDAELLIQQAYADLEYQNLFKSHGILGASRTYDFLLSIAEDTNDYELWNDTANEFIETYCEIDLSQIDSPAHNRIIHEILAKTLIKQYWLAIEFVSLTPRLEKDTKYRVSMNIATNDRRRALQNVLKPPN